MTPPSILQFGSDAISHNNVREVQLISLTVLLYIYRLIRPCIYGNILHAVVDQNVFSTVPVPSFSYQPFRFCISTNPNTSGKRG